MRRLAMREEDTLQTLKNEIETARNQLKPQIEGICGIIAGDLPNFVLRQVRLAFIEDLAYAQSKDDEALRALKGRIAAFGRVLSEEIKTSLLSDMALWWGQNVSLSQTGKTLEGNTGIWQILSGIPERILAYIRKEGIVPLDIVYTTPARFIEGKYLPGMIEKYWVQLAALRALEDALQAAELEAGKAVQASRWDSIE